MKTAGFSLSSHITHCALDKAAVIKQQRIVRIKTYRLCTRLISDSLHDPGNVALENIDYDKLSEKLLAHLLKSMAFTSIRQLYGSLDDAATDDILREAVKRNGRLYIGRRRALSDVTAERRAGRDRVYIGKRTSSSLSD